MKTTKKLVSMLLSLLIFINVFVALPLTASAATTDVSSTGGLSLNGLKAKFPNGAYWNHIANNSHRYDSSLNDVGSCNNPDGYTWSPCYSHSANAPAGQYDCNSFRSAQQCCGFAKK